MFPSKSGLSGSTLKPLAVAIACACGTVSHAQVQAQQPSTASTLPSVNVVGDGIGQNILNTTSGVARLDMPIKDIPQVVNVVPQEILQQQQVTTLEQALRNVPGITVAIGEANGGANGDQFRIRGATTKNDTYLDGLRDFGVYVRDTFNTEQVEVLKGPSSDNFGIGSNGGAINSESKRAHLGNAASITGMYGSGPMNRQTVDINRQLGDTSAVRINMMRQEQDIVDRDGVKSNRWGAAMSLGLGLGTDTTWFLNYVHQSNDRTPDYGQPLIGRSASDVRRPVAGFGVSRTNYYGKDTDRDSTDADIVTSLFKHQFNENTSVSNETRFGYYTRRFSTTTATCDQSCANSYFATGDGRITLGSGGGPSYRQRDGGVQNVTTLATKFDTGPLKHDVRLGLDMAYQTDHRQQYSYMKPDMSGTTTKIPGTLSHPNNQSNNYVVAVNPTAASNVKDSSLTDIALFASDRVHFNPQWSVMGSVRWDSYRQSAKLKTASTGVTTSDVDTNSNFFSPKISLIWEPTEAQTWYVSYGYASTAPWAGSISADANPLGVNSTTSASDTLRSLDPEKTKTAELGGKIDLLDKRLGISGAIFHTEKDNTYYDNGAGGLSATGNKERYNGVELGLSGQITRDWAAYLNYMYLDSKIADSATKANIGNPVQGAPRNSASLWTTYDVTSLFAGNMPGRLVVGGGVTYRDSMYIRDDKQAKVPYSLSYDALVAWDYKNLRLALNGYNLANRINYDNYFAGENADTARAIPSAGRTFILSAQVAF